MNHQAVWSDQFETRTNERARLVYVILFEAGKKEMSEDDSSNYVSEDTSYCTNRTFDLKKKNLCREADIMIEELRNVPTSFKR